MVQHNRIVLSGTLGSSETWSTSVAYIPSGLTPASYVTTQDELNAWATSCAATLIEANYPDLATALSAQGVITSVVAQKFRADNTLERQSIPVTPTFDGSGTADQPYQSCVVFSMLTGIPGASYRGRNYWPGLGLNMTSTGRFSGTAPLAEDWASLLYDFGQEAPVGGPARPAIFSRTRDEVTAVTQIRCGDVPDTQRRRRDGLAENYAVQEYPPA